MVHKMVDTLLGELVMSLFVRLALPQDRKLSGQGGRKDAPFTASLQEKKRRQNQVAAMDGR